MAENTRVGETPPALSAAAYGADGKMRQRVDLPTALFDGTVNLPVLHQAVKAYLANQRQGNAATKTRGLVTGGNRKPWKQKGTGRARQGSIRAPNWVGGGTVFGPRPRSYAQFVPKQVRALARKSAFNARARENAVYVVDSLAFDAPKTSRLQHLLGQLGVSDHKVLLLTDGVKPNVFLSGRNLPMTHVMPYSDVSAYHILWSDVVVIEGTAIGQAIGDDALQERAQTATEPASDATTRRARGATQPAARKSAGKTAAAKKTPARQSAAGTRQAGAKKSGGSTGARKSAPRATKTAKKRSPRKES